MILKVTVVNKEKEFVQSVTGQHTTSGREVKFVRIVRIKNKMTHTMSKETVKKYIEIRVSGESTSGRTQIWQVLNCRHLFICGEIRWHGAFRKYCFYPSNSTLFDWDCLRMVADFCEEKTKEHYETKRKTGK